MRRVKRKKFTDKVSIMMLTICQLARRMADAAAEVVGPLGVPLVRDAHLLDGEHRLIAQVRGLVGHLQLEVRAPVERAGRGVGVAVGVACNVGVAV
jgi:hypothetical protein